MLRFTKGNLPESGTEALVNTVNTIEATDKGIAPQFKKAVSANYQKYRTACKNGELQTGHIPVVKDSNLLTGERPSSTSPTNRTVKIRPRTNISPVV